MIRQNTTYASRPGLSLGEMIAAMVIAAMVLAALLSIYSRADHSAAAVLDQIESPRLATEVLQLIAQDLDRMLYQTSDVNVVIEPGLDHGLTKARMTIRSTIRNEKGQPVPLQEIVWLAAFDYDSPTPRLVLYRSYSGIGVEDKLLDTQRANWEQNFPFVPICAGLTLFKIEVPQAGNPVYFWQGLSLPPGIKVTLSFAEPFQTVTGALDVPDAAKVSRTIAVNRTRRIALDMTAPPPEPNEPNEPNVPSVPTTPNKPSVPDGRVVPNKSSIPNRSNMPSMPNEKPPTKPK